MKKRKLGKSERRTIPYLLGKHEWSEWVERHRRQSCEGVAVTECGQRRNFNAGTEFVDFLGFLISLKIPAVKCQSQSDKPVDWMEKVTDEEYLRKA
jgi:hypothetical protein